MPSATCLVTGVAGFIGSQLAEQLIRAGHTVIGVDCFTDFYPRWIKEGNLIQLRDEERFHFLQADLLSVDLSAILRGELSTPCGVRQLGEVEYVFHLAAQAGVRDSWGHSFEVYDRNNILATQRLLEAAKGISLKKFVYASSSSIYGDAESFPTPETTTPHPVSPYGVTKLAAEHLSLLYWHNFGVPAVALRFFTVYGPRQRPDMAFHKFIRAILEGREIVVLGDGEQTRDFTFVGDTVEGIIRAAGSTATGEAFNLGGGSRVSVNRVIQLLEGITEREARIRYVAVGQGDVRHTSADIRRAESILGYRPSTTLAEGLRRERAWLDTLVPAGSTR